LQPCLGIESVESTIGRQACYLAHAELLGEDRSDLGCAPALYADVQEDVDFLFNDYVVAVESCDKQCANVLVGEKGGKAHATIMVEEVLTKAGIDAKSLPREHLPMSHPAVKAVAEEIARVSEELLKGGEG
jgi:uncharacterized metal-binding protein